MGDILASFRVGVLRAALLAAVLALSPLASGPAQPAEEILSPAEIEAIQSMIGKYLRENPEIVGEAIKKLVEKDRAEEQERRLDNLIVLRDDLNHDPGSPVTGNAKGDVTLVEFFDYNCPYCKVVSEDLRQLIAGDNNLRFVFKEWPILGPTSTFAARAALAARKQGKYADLHWALMSLKARPSEAIVMRLAKQVGLDVDQLRDDMDTTEIDDILERNLQLARTLGLTGTPVFVIGEELIPGKIETSELKALIKEERGKLRP